MVGRGVAEVGLGHQTEGLADRHRLRPLPGRRGVDEAFQQLGRTATMTGAKMTLGRRPTEAREPLVPHLPDLPFAPSGHDGGAGRPGPQSPVGAVVAIDYSFSL